MINQAVWKCAAHFCRPPPWPRIRCKNIFLSRRIIHHGFGVLCPARTCLSPVLLGQKGEGNILDVSWRFDCLSCGVCTGAPAVLVQCSVHCTHLNPPPRPPTSLCTELFTHLCKTAKLTTQRQKGVREGRREWGMGGGKWGRWKGVSGIHKGGGACRRGGGGSEEAEFDECSAGNSSGHSSSLGYACSSAVEGNKGGGWMEIEEL